MPRAERRAWTLRRFPVGGRAGILLLIGAFVAPVGAGGCFDLPPPSLAADTPDAAALPTEPPDAATDPVGIDAQLPPPAAGADAAPPRPDSAPSGADASPARVFRCGATDSCNPVTQECCATFANPGWVYQVFDVAVKCPGVPIGCAQPSDCDTQSECCTANTFQGCVPRNTCSGFPGGHLTCDPALGSSDCPVGTQCVHYPDPTIPYYLCD